MSPGRPLLLALLSMLLTISSGACKSSKSTPKHRQSSIPPAATTQEGFFAKDAFHDIQLTLPADAIEALREKPRSYVEGILVYGDVQYPVSVKLKGHRSFRDVDNKPALKIRFDKQDVEASFFGLRRLTLNNMVDDPTRMRETLGYQMYRAAGVAAPRTAYSLLTLNGEYMGIYLALEPIDEVFVATHFSEPIGGLYEAEYGCDFFPPDVESFERDCGPEESRARLAAMAKAAVVSDPKLLAADSPYLDSEAVKSYLAVSTLLGDFDGYWHSHNYFLYEKGPGGKWLVLPWGIDRVFNDRVEIHGSRGRLAEICFANKECRFDYGKRLLELATLMEGMELTQEMRRISTLLGPMANTDPRDDTTLEKRQEKKRRMRDFIARRPEEIREDLTCIADGAEVDSDKDGYGCDDCAAGDPAIHPGAVELCDDVDNDCNGLVDDGPDCPCETLTSEGVTFHLCEWRLSWPEARDFCASRGLSLATIDNEKQSEEIFRRALELDENRWWIGGSDRAKEEDWRWIDGTPVQWNYWGSGQPNDNQCGQDCASFDDVGTGEWVDSHCEQNYPFVCR